MRRDRVLVGAQAVLAIGLLWWVVGLYPGTASVWAALHAQIWTALAFALATAVLGLSGVWLPRGDSVDTTAATAFAAAVLMNPVIAAGVLVSSRLVVALLRSRSRSPWTVLENASRRVLLVAVTFGLLGPGTLNTLRAASSWPEYARVGAAAAAFIAVDLLLEQAHASLRFRAPFVPLLLGNTRLQRWVVAAELSVAVLTVLLFPQMGFWGLLVTVGLLLVMQQSFALLLDVRASYTSTVEVLARAIEAYDPDRRGHAERVAAMVGEAGRLLGFQSRRLESLTYAALFHDVGFLGSDQLDEIAPYRSSEVIASVSFLAPSVPVLAILDSGAVSEDSLDEHDLVGAYLVAHFSAFDSETAMKRHESRDVADAIGARLYATTRRRADRAVRRVELGTLRRTSASSATPGPAS